MKMIRTKLAIALGCAAATVFISSAGAETSQLEEVIVSATYRDTKLMDTPVAISAITNEAIFERGFDDITTLYKAVPGLGYSTQAHGWNLLTIRGLTSPAAAGAAPVGVYMDNMPMTDSTPGGLRQTLGELFDMARVEVLKGPQGTLYGEGSMGGSIRYITNQPDPSGFDFSFQGRLDTAEDSTGLSHVINGMVNIPIGDQVALRVVAFQRDRQGFLDLLGPSGEDDADWFEQDGVRARLTWFASDTLEISAMANISNAEFGPGHTAIHCTFETGPTTPYGELPVYLDTAEICTPTQGARYRRSNSEARVSTTGAPGMTNGGIDENEQYNITIDWQLPFATLTASTSYLEREMGLGSEASSGQIALVDYLFNAYGGVTNGTVQGFASDNAQDRLTERVVHEFRLISNSDSKLQWTAGVFYKEEDAQQGRQDQDCYNGGGPVYATLSSDVYNCWIQFSVNPDAALIDQQTVVTLGETLFGAGNVYNTNTEAAVFGEASYRFNDQWELLVGARYAQVTNQLDTQAAGIESRSNPTNSLETQTNVLSPKVTLTWRSNDDWMVYGTVSHGFRPGVVNEGLASIVSTLNAARDGNQIAEQAYQSFVGAQELDSDEVINYELGTKGTFADGRVSVTAALYHIDWQDTVVTTTGTINDVPGVLPLPFSYAENSGEAESQGLELEITALLSDSVTLDIGGDWNWTADILTGGQGRYGGAAFEPGSRLTNAPKYTAYASLAWNFDLAGLDATLRADGYIRAPKFWELSGTLTTPSSETLDLKLLVNIDHWRASIFVSNVLDHINPVDLNTNGWVFGAPRTIGVQFSYNNL